MIEIHSERLRFIPLDNEMLFIWKNLGRPNLEKFLNLNPNNWDIEDYYFKETQDALHNFWSIQTKTNPIQFCWYTNWEIILKSTNQSIGGIGFNGPANLKGENEMGYFIDKKFRNFGYATEATARLIQWASQDSRLKNITAKTFENNLNSRKVLLKNQFELIKQEDNIEFWKKELSLNNEKFHIL
ncbi:MAG: Ribosomal-protein-alanine N-acetyltransferase [Bacteroidota bacterium]|jgi:RimJ/RimL family protein N-acetyltransferase